LIKVLERFRYGMVYRIWKLGLSAPGVAEMAERIERARVAANRNEDAKRQAWRDIRKRKRAA
jgi:hypothetical protein